MNRSVSSTFITVWAFNLNCFLRNVSISTSILSSRGGACTTALKELDESGIQANHFTRKSLHARYFNFNHTFGTAAVAGYANYYDAAMSFVNYYIREAPLPT